MRIDSVRAYHLSVPLRFAFTHSRASRRRSDNVVIALGLDCGVTGYGEGVPRQYVTGETPEGVFETLGKVDFPGMDEAVGSAADPASALIGVASRLPVKGNAARCALEIALLDAAGRISGERLSGTIRRLFSRPARGRSPLRYSAVISLGGRGRGALIALLLRLSGFRDLKVKIGADAALETERVRAIRKWFGRGRIRLDANGCLDREGFAALLREMERSGVWAIEDPVGDGDMRVPVRVTEGRRVPVIIDERFLTGQDAVKFLDESPSCILNIRISKCGGVLAASEIASDAIARGGAFGLGCQVGESAILSAAGRHFAEAFPEAVFLEGSYDRYLLADNVAVKGVGFGYGGRWRGLGGCGLGIDVSPSKLAKLSCRALELWKRG